MFKFLFVIFFFFILLVFLMGFSILRTFKNIFFGSGNSTRKGEQRRQTNSNTSGHRSTTTTARDVHLMCTVRRYSPRMKGSMWITRKLNRA